MKDPNARGTALDPSDAVLTVPNVITLARLALLPVFVWLALAKHSFGAAFWLGAFIGATDFFDGLAARRLHQVSRLGTTLDPLFDRIVVAVTAAVLLGLHLVPIAAMVIVLARDAALVVAGAYMQRRGVDRPAVTWLGKWGSFGTMYAMGIFLASAIDVRLRHPFRALAWSSLVPPITFSYLAAVGYARTTLRALRTPTAAG